jgi:hypothetical protein
MAEDFAGTLAEEQEGTSGCMRRMFQVGDEVEWRDKARRFHAGKVVEDELLGRCKVLLEGRGSARSVGVTSLLFVRDRAEVSSLSPKVTKSVENAWVALDSGFRENGCVGAITCG